MAHSLPLEWWRSQDSTTTLTVPEVGAEPEGGSVAFWLLVTFTVILLLAPQQYLPFLAVVRINLVVACLALVAHLVWPPRQAAMRFPMELRLVLGLVACGLLSVPSSFWRSGSVDALVEFLRVALIFWLIGQDVCTVRRLRIMAWTLALASVPISWTALSNHAAGVFLQNERVVGYGGNLTSNPNDLALTLNLFLPITVALALVSRRAVVRVLAWGISGLAVGGVVVTLSRGGFLTLVIVGLLVATLVVRRLGSRGILAAALCVGMGVAVAPAGYADRLSTILDTDSDQTGSAQGRKADAAVAIDYVIRHPIVGAGIGQSVLALNEVRSEGPLWVAVHNAYLNYGVDMGFPGLILFAALVTASFLSARRVERLGRSVPDELRVLASGVRVSLAGFAVAALFHPVSYHFYFFYLAGLAVALKATAVRQFNARLPR